MGIDLSQLDSESSDLDLIVGSSSAFDGSIGEVSTEVSSPVHPISRSEPELSSGSTDERIDSVSEDGSLREPVLDELLLGCFGVEVTFGHSSGSNVELSDLSDGALDVPIGSVDDEELDVDHSLSGRHDVLLSSEEGSVDRDGRDSEVGDGSLGLGGSVHVDDPDVRSEGLETGAVSFREDVSDEEGVSKGRDLGGGSGGEELTHGCKKDR